MEMFSVYFAKFFKTAILKKHGLLLQLYFYFSYQRSLQMTSDGLAYGLACSTSTSIILHNVVPLNREMSPKLFYTILHLLTKFFACPFLCHPTQT